MFKRLFWLTIGAGFGFGLSFWLMRTIREVAGRYTPERVSGDIAASIRQLGSDLRAASHEFRVGMAEREAELRDQLASAGRPVPTHR